MLKKIKNIDKYFSFIFILSILGIFSYFYINIFHIQIMDSYLIFSNFTDNILDVMKLRIIVPEGRFLPFQFTDFYLLNIFDVKNNVYILAINIILKVSLSLFILFLIFKDINKFIYKKKKLNYFLYCFVSLFYLTTIYINFFSIHFSEVMQSLMVFLFIFFYQRGYFTNKPKYYILALLSCVYVTYMKETMFIPFLVIGVTNFLFLDEKQSKLREGVNLLLILNAVMFLIIYYIIIFCNSSNHYMYYNYQKDSIYYFFLSIDFALILLALLSIIKGIMFFLTKKISWYDSLLFAGVSYSFIILFLGLKENWYHFVSFTYLSVYLLYLIPKIKFKLIKYCIICLMLLNIILMIYRNYNIIEYFCYQKERVAEFNSHIKNNNYIYIVIKEIKPTVISYYNENFISDNFDKIKNHLWIFKTYKEYFKCYDIPYDNFYFTTTFNVGPKGSIFIVDEDVLLQNNTFSYGNFKQLPYNHFNDNKKYFEKIN